MTCLPHISHASPRRWQTTNWLSMALINSYKNMFSGRIMYLHGQFSCSYYCILTITLLALHNKRLAAVELTARLMGCFWMSGCLTWVIPHVNNVGFKNTMCQGIEFWWHSCLTKSNQQQQCFAYFKLNQRVLIQYLRGT